MMLFIKRITKAQIRLRVCSGGSAPLLFATPVDRFSQVEAHFIVLFHFVQTYLQCLNIDSPYRFSYFEYNKIYVSTLFIFSA